MNVKWGQWTDNQREIERVDEIMSVSKQKEIEHPSKSASAIHPG
jgi:hypothetical protein